MKRNIYRKMISTLLSLVLIVTMLPLPAAVYAAADPAAEVSVIASGGCGETATWSLDENYVLTIGGTGVMEDYGDALESRGWAEYTSQVKKLVIEEGITSTGSEGTDVGSYAFNDFTALTEVSLPSTLNYIAFKTFPTSAPITTLRIADLESYCNIDVGHTWWSNGCYVMGSDGLDVYVDGELVTELVIPGSFKKIRANAFMYWKNLTKVTVEDGIETIEDSCFNCCYELTEVNLPESVTTVGNYVFLSCHSLEELTLPNSATSIGASLISTNSSVPLKKLTMPITHRGTEIGGLNNGVPSSLTTFVFTPGTTGAGYDYNTAAVTSNKSYKNTAWYYLRNRTLNVTLEEGITHIGNYMFKECAGITELTIPSTVTSIGTEAIGSDVKLKVYHGTYGETFAEENGNSYEVLHNYKKTGEVASTCQSQGYSTYKCQASKCTQTQKEYLPLAEHQFETTYTFEDGTEFGYCSYNCGTSNFEEERNCTVSGTSSDTVSWSLYDDTYLVLSGYGDMEDYTTSPLEGCNVKYCYVEDGITSIGANFFANTNLAVIDIPDSVAEIDMTAFTGCQNLQTIHISEFHPSYRVSENILSDTDGETILLYFGNKAEKEIPGQYTAIGSDAFVSSKADTKVMIPFDMESIEDAKTFANVKPYVYDNSYARRYLESNGVSWNSRGMYQLPWDNEDVHYQMAYHKLVQYLKDQPSKKATTQFTMKNTGMSHTLTVAYADGKVEMKLTSTKSAAKYDTCIYLDESGLVNNNIYIEAALNGSVDQGFTGILEREVSTIEYGDATRLWDIEPGYLIGNFLDKVSSTVMANQLLDVLLFNASAEVLDDAGLTIIDLGFKHFYTNTEDTLHLDVEETDGVTPGCLTGGRTPNLSCNLCGAYREGESQNPTGHSWEENYTEDVPASCTSEGSKSIHCSACDATKDASPIGTTPHSYGKWIVDKEPTCTEEGHRYRECISASCNAIEAESLDKKAHVYSEATCTKAKTCKNCPATSGEKLGHKYSTSYTVDKKATLSGEGSKSKHCSRCGGKTSVTTIAKVTSFKLSSTSYTYDGKAKTPIVTVTDSNKRTVASKYYTVSYKNNKNAGTGIAVITFKGEYAGTKQLTFKIRPRAISSLSLSQTTYTYNGSAKKPSVTVKSGSVVLLSKQTKSNASATVTYASGGKNVGKYKVTVKGKGNYTGTITKTFTINPAKPTISKPVAAKKQITAKWKKVSKQADGYEVMYSTSKTFKKGSATKTKVVKGATKTSLKITKLKAKKPYYVKVRTYKKVSGKTYYSAWSDPKTVKTK